MSEPTQVSDDLLPMVHMLAIALERVPEQLHDNGLTEQEALDIRQCINPLVEALRRHGQESR